MAEEEWTSLRGGYGVPYDPRPAIEAIRQGTDTAPAWDELWRELHHQGDLGEASYAALIELSDLEPREPDLLQYYALAGCIETERHRRTNPPLRDAWRTAYGEACRHIVDSALRDLSQPHDHDVVQAALGFVALRRGAPALGALISTLDRSVLEATLNDLLEWTELYEPDSD